MCDIQVNGLKMYEKALSEWREAHADAYSKFKQDLEEELEQPCHQILEMEDDYAKCLRSVVTNLTAHVTPNGVDFAELYSQALETGDVSAYCLCCYLLLDNGAEKFIKVVETRIEQPGAEEIIEGLWKYRRFCKQSRRRETDNITKLKFPTCHFTGFRE